MYVPGAATMRKRPAASVLPPPRRRCRPRARRVTLTAASGLPDGDSTTVPVTVPFCAAAGAERAKAAASAASIPGYDFGNRISTLHRSGTAAAPAGGGLWTPGPRMSRAAR